MSVKKKEEIDNPLTGVQVNDKHLIISHTPSKVYIWLGFIPIFIYFLFSTFDDWVWGGFISIIFSFIFLFPGLYLIIAWIIKPKRVITFDRINGTVTFYGIRWGKEITQKFEEACFSSTIRHMKYLPIGFELSLRRNKIGFISIDVDPFYEKGVSPEEIFSYLVWYMDKNRPLPPGSALDPYRKKDYKRRKKRRISTTTISLIY